MLQLAGARQQLPSRPELTSVQVQLEHAGQEARQVARRDLLAGTPLLAPDERLVPATKHGESERHLPEDEPLVPPIADPSRVFERMLEQLDRVPIAVPLETEVGEVPVELADGRVKLVSER